MGGQISVLDANGELVHSVNPIPVTILPGERGLFTELFDLAEPAQDGQLEVTIAVDRFKDPATSPVTFSKLDYRIDEFGGCSISGTVSNSFTEQKENLQLRVAGFVGDELAMGGFTYVDLVFPGKDATFEANWFDDATCPDAVDRIEVLPNMSEDKIYNP